MRDALKYERSDRRGANNKDNLHWFKFLTWNLVGLEFYVTWIFL